MELGRLRKGEWLLAAASVALLAVMFLPWFRSVLLVETDTRAEVVAQLTAWQAFTLWDLVLAAVAALGLASAALAATRRAPAGPVAAVVVTSGVAILVAPVLLLRIVFPPGPNALVEPRYGAWLGLLCAIGIGAGAWLAMGDERTDAADPPWIEPQPVPPEVARAGSAVAEGRSPEADAERD